MNTTADLRCLQCHVVEVKGQIHQNNVLNSKLCPGPTRGTPRTVRGRTTRRGRRGSRSWTTDRGGRGRYEDTTCIDTVKLGYMVFIVIMWTSRLLNLFCGQFSSSQMIDVLYYTRLYICEFSKGIMV